MKNNFDVDAIIRDLLIASAAEEYMVVPEIAPQISLPYQKKFAKMYNNPFGYEKRRNMPIGRRLRRLTVAAVLLLAILCGAIFAIPQTRTIAINMLIKWYDEYASIVFLGANNELTALPDIEISYLPEGYELVYESDKTEIIRRVWEYRDEEDNILSISIYLTQSEPSIYIDNEHKELKYVKLSSGVEGQLWQTVDDFPSTLLWNSEDGSLLLSISGKISKDELLRIANGIQIGK